MLHDKGHLPEVCLVRIMPCMYVTVFVKVLYVSTREIRNKMRKFA